MSNIPPDLSHIDPFSDALTATEAVGLHLCLSKIEHYISKGRIKEAQGAKSMVSIMWQALNREPNIDTGWGEL
jgi:hypothetical protein